MGSPLPVMVAAATAVMAVSIVVTGVEPAAGSASHRIREFVEPTERLRPGLGRARWRAGSR